MFIQSANAATVTGNEFYRQLKSDDSNENLQAYAYLYGVLDTEDMFYGADVFALMIDIDKNKNAKFKTNHFCFGDSKITYRQISDVVQKYLDANPQKRHEPANGLIRTALIESFPCAKNS